MSAQPTDEVFLNYAAVGAAIVRPPVKIRSDEKRRTSAEKISVNITGRAPAKMTTRRFKPNRPSDEERTSDARPYKL